MNNYIKSAIKLYFFCLALIIMVGCSTQKDNAANRSLQNLSARYNLIYNSNVLLTAYQDELLKTHTDNYDHLLAVYIAPAAIDYLSATSNVADVKTLDEIAQKAQTIVAEKSLSNYLDEANILLAKTNFYRGNYFTAAAYFDYTAKAFGNDRQVLVKAMTWKARSLMQLNDDEKAIKVLDTVALFLDSIKKDRPEALATLAQMHIFQEDFKNAIKELETAVKESHTAQERIRWSYILAQLYENEGLYEPSLRYYTKVEKSNAPFEMYFNARLSQIRINDKLSNNTSNRKEQLLKLLKDDKNIGYTDQIYYEVAEDYLAHHDYQKAQEYYKLAVQNSVRNLNQKGISYLKLADLNFRNLRDYVSAKRYYDSASVLLPKTYPGYDAIVKKSQNLEYLTDRYATIATQDTLQLYAKMPKQERESRMDKMFANAQRAAQQTQGNATPTVVASNPNVPAPIRTINQGTFYFANASAVSRGFNDFKRRWGNRPLEDNWRQNLKTSAQANQQAQTNVINNGATTISTIQTATDSVRNAQIATFTASLPLTQEQLKLSDQKIIDAYFEIAVFYQQVLADQKEAIKVFETLLERYPKNNHLETIYYSLYLAHSTSNKSISDQYKNLILTKYPGSIYARAITEPDFSFQLNALDLVINSTYNAVFESYLKKDFRAVITKVKETNERFPSNSLQAQYDYLKAISIGRTQHVDSLLNAFNQILTSYPSDKLITPLVKDHIAYINANLPKFKARKIALIDFDPTEPRFIAQQNTTAPTKQVSNKPNSTQAESKPIEPKPAPVNPPVNPATNLPAQNTAKKDSILTAAKVDALFTKKESNLYYYVIAVNDMSLSVSSSRFGVGQFNRGNYAGTGIKHQLLEMDEDQLIFVGDFNTLAEVKEYADGITPQLPRIMKVPLANYKGFYISKENFDNIKNRETLNRYLEFFKNNY